MERKTISHLCFALLLSLIIMGVSASVIGTLLTVFSLYFFGITSSDSFINGLMLLATALGLLLLYFSFKQMTKGIFAPRVGTKTLPAKELALVGLSGFGLSLFFAYLGIGLNSGISYLITGKFTSLSESSIVSNTLENSPLLPTLLYVVIIGPLLEELIFRKTLISKLRPFGYKTSILVSSVLFGAYHLNLEQFFYAAFIGIIFGAIYYKSNNIVYTYVIHACFNLSSVFLTQIQPRFPLFAIIFYYGLNLVGLIIFFVYGYQWIKEKPLESYYCVSQKDTWGNKGMIIFLLFSLVASIFSLVSTNFLH